MKNTLFISDTHFYHKNIIQYSMRPYLSVEDMNESMIQNWNNNVNDGDDIYHMGDISFARYAQTKEILSKLNGNIHIILGNHDKVIEHYKQDLIQSNIVKTIQNYKEISINNQLIVLSHFAFRVWHKSHYGSIHCYGHSHGSLPPIGKSVDVGVDCKEITEEYRPIHLEELLNYMGKKDVVNLDYHNESLGR